MGKFYNPGTRVSYNPACEPMKVEPTFEPSRAWFFSKESARNWASQHNQSKIQYIQESDLYFINISDPSRRTTSSFENFPWMDKHLCYIEVLSDGSVQQIDHLNTSHRKDALDACFRQIHADSRIYVIWPGKWETGLFEVDDVGPLIHHFSD